MRKLTRYRENQNNYIHLARLLLDLSNIAIHAKKKNHNVTQSNNVNFPPRYPHFLRRFVFPTQTPVIYP